MRYRLNWPLHFSCMLQWNTSSMECWIEEKEIHIVAESGSHANDCGTRVIFFVMECESHALA